MSFQLDKLRDIASVQPFSGDPVVYERWQLATELLACREELAAERERFNLLSQRCAAAELWRERLQSVLLSKHGGEPLALLSELDEARAEAENLREFAERNGKAATERFDLLVRCREAIGISGDEPTLAQISMVPDLVAGVVARLEQNDRDLRTELAAVKRQRDELTNRIRHSSVPAGCLAGDTWVVSRCDVLQWVDELFAAEQPKPQQPEVQP